MAKNIFSLLFILFFVPCLSQKQGDSFLEHNTFLCHSERSEESLNTSKHEQNSLSLTQQDEIVHNEFHSDHTIFGVNKLDPQADFFAYESEEKAMQNRREESCRLLSLYRDWKFNWVKSPKDRIIKFYDINLDDSEWNTIPVPANWEVQGYDYPIYLDERYPFSTHWPDVPEDYNPVGTYRHVFNIPFDWINEDIILHFAGAKSAMYSFPDSIAELILDYTLTAMGEIIIDYNFRILSDSLPNIPRVGLSMMMPQSYSNVSWYGRGPHETYWDRKSSGKIAIYEGRVEDQFHRYPRPQEIGNETDVRWMTLESDSLYVTVQPLDSKFLSCSVWHFAASELDFKVGKGGGMSASGLVPVASKYGADIEAGKVVHWNFDHLQMGVGGDTLWGRKVHDQYTIHPDNIGYSIVIIPRIAW
ncbi:MAG: hypothetical protein HQ521_15030 [Bacteroidetes bacterium]|nr:hypothetical protein [Bacteroidota bacterium]